MVGGFRTASVVMMIIHVAIWSQPQHGAVGISHWDRQDIDARQGDDVIVTCIITEFGFLDVVRISRKDGEGAEVTISDNEIIKSPFSGVPRFKTFFTFHQQNRSATLVLQLQGVRGEDSGTFNCHMLSNEQDRALLRLNVIVPIESVRFSSFSEEDEEVTEEHEIVLAEGIKRGVACTAVVNGSLTPPTVQLLLDSYDITSLFNSSKDSKVIRGDVGLDILYSEMKLFFVTDSPDPNWNEKRLTCVGKRHGFPDETTSVGIVVQYRPVVTCFKAGEYAKIGDSVRLHCEVKSNPRSTIIWRKNAEQELTEDDTIRMTEKFVKPDVSEVSLDFLSVNQSHFAVYTVMARNGHGHHSADVELIQVTSPPSDDNDDDEDDDIWRPDTVYDVPRPESNRDQGNISSRSQRFFSGIAASMLVLTGCLASLTVVLSG